MCCSRTGERFCPRSVFVSPQTAISIDLLPFPSKALLSKVLLQCIGIPAAPNFPDAFRLELVMAIANAPFSAGISGISIEKTFRYDWGLKFWYDSTRE